MKMILQTCLCFLLIYSAKAQNPNPEFNNDPAPPSVHSISSMPHETIPVPGSEVSGKTLTYKVIPGRENSWGYEIFLDSKIVHRQLYRPSLPGMRGFDEKKQAELVAKLTMNKIRQGHPPALFSIEEYKSIGISVE